VQAGEPSLLTRILAAIAGAILLVLGFMFSLVILVLIAVAGLAAWGWFWWKTRELRKAMKQRPAGGHVIDGEAIVVDDSSPIRTVREVELPHKPD
jgi:UPF0716 family protein affecting phage T7 exclusion